MGGNLSSYSSDKELISRTYRELKKLNPQRIISMKKWSHELNREFSKEEIQMASKYMKTCSTSLVIKEKQIKTTLRLHLTPVTMPYSRAIMTKAGEDMANKEPLYTAGGNAN
jgi:hypothetical protein